MREAEQQAREREERDEAHGEREKERAKAKEKGKGSGNGCVGTLVPIAVVLGIAAFGAGMFYYEKYVVPAEWDGHTSFKCKSGSFTFIDIQATSPLEASETCQVTLVRPAFEAQLRARDHANIYVTDGRIHTSGTAVDASGFARIVLTGTAIDGKVSATGSSVVESRNAKILGKVSSDGPANLVGFPPTPSPAALASAALAQQHRLSPGSTVCVGVTDCYKTYSGQVAGRLVVQLDAHGNVKSVSYSGTASPDQKKCLLDLGHKKALTDAPPGVGQLVCDYSGTVSHGIEMIAETGTFVPAPR